MMIHQQGTKVPRAGQSQFARVCIEYSINHGHKFSRREILRKDAVDLFERLCGGWMERRDGAQKGPSGGHQEGSGHALSGDIGESDAITLIAKINEIGRASWRERV